MKQLRTPERVQVVQDGTRILAIHWRDHAYAVREQRSPWLYRGRWYALPGLLGERRTYQPLLTTRGEVEIYLLERPNEDPAWYLTRMWD
jgi:hypothetical protein